MIILMLEQEILTAFRNATCRLLLLDYDGTLREYEPTPQAASPTPAIRELLSQLTAQPATTVIINSGRDCDTLDAWFGDLPVGFTADHGLFHKQSGGEWQPTIPMDDVWKKQVRAIMARASLQVPGSLIEEKGSLVWHYRQAEPEAAERVADELGKQLAVLAGRYHLVVMPGNKIVEVRYRGADKGKAAAYWLKQQPWDFVLAAGDDRTDEDMLAAMPDSAFTIRVGGGHTVARHAVTGPAEFRALLSQLT
jgi:trehalose 6-phosphate synthase/phosphatase